MTLGIAKNELAYKLSKSKLIMASFKVSNKSKKFVKLK